MGLPDPPITAKQWAGIRARAKAGDAGARFDEGYYFANGAKDRQRRVVVKQDYRKALAAYESLANDGDVSAQDALGWLLSDHSKSFYDLRRARHWLKKAEAQGSCTAAQNLGAIERDRGRYREAFVCYRCAAELDSGDAHLTIALCHLFGIGTRRDQAAAEASLRALLAPDRSHLCCQRSLEHGQFWLAVLRGMKGDGTHTMTQLLKVCDQDHDHEMAGELLKLFGPRF